MRADSGLLGAIGVNYWCFTFSQGILLFSSVTYLDCAKKGNGSEGVMLTESLKLGDYYSITFREEPD